MKLSPGWILIGTLVTTPVVLWIFAAPLNERFIGTYGVLTAIGQLLGLVGMAAFAVTMILSGRLRIFDNLFGGIPRAYIVHHIMGAVSFSLLLLHPLPLALRQVETSWRLAASLFLPGIDWAINFGLSALFLMIALLLFTFFIELPYHIWKWTHKFLGLAFGFAILHSLYISSDVTVYPPLRIYLLILSIGGLLVFTYRTLLGRFFVRRLPYLVERSTQVSKSIWEIVLSPLSDKTITFEPGQFIFVGFRAISVSGEMHPFSLTSPAQSGNLSFSAKALGDFTQTLSMVTPGMRAMIEGPYGRFSYEYHKDGAYIWIAGGIGVTPFVSMGRSIPSNTARIDCYYCIKDETEAVYLAELQAIATSNPSFRVFPWFTKTQGRLTADMLTRASGPLNQYTVFLCGPPFMMTQMKKQLKALGVRSDKIITEEFELLA